MDVTYRAMVDLADAGNVITESTFDWYRPQSIRFDEAMAHPTPLVESAALASCKPPVPKRVLKLPAYLVREGIVSESQLEAMTYAMDAFERNVIVKKRVAYVNDAGQTATRDEWRTYRQGFMLGDGAGSGKGRTSAGLIIAKRRRGHASAAIWISENTRLYNDAIRDYIAVGGDPKNIVKLGRYGIDEDIALEEGVIFCTYASLRSKVMRPDPAFPTDPTKAVAITRLEQIIAWLGAEAFEGMVVFDESQNLQNAMPRESNNWFGATKPSQQALAALEIQDLLPNARVLYVSATSADHLEALAYAPRLGMWGQNTAFESREKFLEAMKAGGMTALEMVCRDLKSMGTYCSRQLAQDDITRETLVHELDDDQIQQLKTFNKVWRLISTGFEQALVLTGAARPIGNNRLVLPTAGSAVSKSRSQLESGKQRFYMLILIALRMPTVIADIRRRLDAGESCVLQMHNTQEASLIKALTEFDANPGMSLEDLDLSPRRELIEFVERCFPVDEYQVVSDDKNTDKLIPLMHAATGLPIQNARALDLRGQVLREIEQLMVPEAPIDTIINAFGPDVVAEVTGRKRRLVRQETATGATELVLEKRGSTANAREIEAFMNGPKRVLIFSECAGGVGASYHADRSCSNQTHRNHYLLQIPWRSIDAVQGMGRTNRTNQASSPHYVLTTTNVPAEKRFISTIAKRLDELGSLTRGQRDATSTNEMFSSEDNLETKYGEGALRELMEVFNQDKFEGMSQAEFFPPDRYRLGLGVPGLQGHKESRSLPDGQCVAFPQPPFGGGIRRRRWPPATAARRPDGSGGRTPRASRRRRNLRPRADDDRADLAAKNRGHPTLHGCGLGCRNAPGEDAHDRQNRAALLRGRPTEEVLLHELRGPGSRLRLAHRSEWRRRPADPVPDLRRRTLGEYPRHLPLRRNRAQAPCRCGVSAHLRRRGAQDVAGRAGRRDAHRDDHVLARLRYAAPHLGSLRRLDAGHLAHAHR